MPMGPVQLLVVGFEDPQFKGSVLAELARLRDNDVVRLIDLLVVRKDDEGKVEHVEHTDLTPEEAEAFGAIVGALMGFETDDPNVAPARGDVLGADDAWYVDDAIPNGSAAAVALIEHRWAIALRDAIRDAGGFHIADSWVHPADLVAIGLLAAEEAAAH
jgi:uncharacterized membrane protein